MTIIDEVRSDAARAIAAHLEHDVFQKIDFFLQLAGYILDERVGGDLGIMAYHLGEVPCETRRLFGRARDVNRGDIRAVWAAEILLIWSTMPTTSSSSVADTRTRLWSGRRR
jgi:hypothetical protein